MTRRRKIINIGLAFAIPLVISFSFIGAVAMFGRASITSERPSNVCVSRPENCRSNAPGSRHF